jgi:hypothetical protein
MMKTMRIAGLLAVAPVLACVLALSPQWVEAAKPKQPAPSIDERELLKACRSRLLALNHFDVATIDQLTHRDYIGTADDGARLSKDELLKAYAPHSSEPPNSYGPIEEVQMHIYGGTGIVNYRIELKERIGDRDIVTALRRTDVFLKEGGRWQAVSAQLTPIPISRLTPVAADATTYDDYVGDYEIATDNVEHVTRDGEKLMGETSRGQAEFLSLGPDKFFFRNDTGQVTFARDDAGKVTGYSYQRCDGQQIAARKIR